MCIYDVEYVNSRNYRNLATKSSDLENFCKSEKINLEYLLYTLSSLKRK